MAHPDNVAAKNAYIFFSHFRNIGTKNLQANHIGEFITKWTDQINRDGLIKPNTKFFEFVKEIEVVARSFMTLDFLRT